MRVSVIGAKGYPYVYGGYDTFVKELSERLVKKDVTVTVYCHKKLFKEKPAIVNGINLKYTPAIETKSLSQLTHSLISIFDACFSKTDIILVVNAANGPYGLITKLFRKKTIINIDGIEWRRPKWEGLGAKYFYFASWCATKLYDQIIADADEMKNVYQEEFKTNSEVIAYGANLASDQHSSILEKLKLQPRDYYLIIGRLIPDNNADIILNGFLKSSSSKKLVIVGDVSYKDAFADAIKETKDHRFIFAGYVNSSAELSDLYYHCYAYIHGHEFGGTNPTMIQALASKCFILAINTRFSREMLSNGKFGMFFDKHSDSICNLLNEVDTSESVAEEFRQKSVSAITDKYNWDCITEKYLTVMHMLLKKD